MGETIYTSQKAQIIVNGEITKPYEKQKETNKDIPCCHYYLS